MSVKWADDLGITEDPDRFEEAISVFRRRVPMTEDEFQALEDAEYERAFKVAGVMDADLVQEVFDALDDAIADGTTFEEFQAKVGADLEAAWAGEAPTTLETVFRTNTMGAYNAGRREIFTRPEVKEARPYWRFDAISDERTDEDCEAADGTVLDADDDWWKTHTPPLHPNCRCSFIALSQEEAEEEGIDTDVPDADAADGFGDEASDEDWEPDFSQFDEQIGSILSDKLDDAE